jgi:hypothetical protein
MAVLLVNLDITVLFLEVKLVIEYFVLLALIAQWVLEYLQTVLVDLLMANRDK